MPHTILLVDDEAHWLSRFARLLEELGQYRVIQAYSPAEARPHLGKADLVVADMQMQGDIEAGLTFARAVRGEHPALPVAILSSGSHLAREAAERGEITRYFTKRSAWMNYKDFLAAVQEILAAAQKGQDDDSKQAIHSG